MMRLTRTASLLVVFYLLTSAATAYAECAWVVRVFPQSSAGRTQSGWTPMGGWDTRTQCEEARLRVAYSGGVLRTDVTTTCLPGNVDPRGPR
jgi:hypothetical protein